MEGLTEENASDNMKRKATSYLTMLLTWKAFKFLNRSIEPKDRWDALEEKFAPTEDEDCYELRISSNST